MLCSESLLFSFSTHELNSDPQELRKHFFLVPPRFVFLVKTGSIYFSHGKSFLGNQIALSTKCHLSYLLQNPSKSTAYLFCHVCYTYSKCVLSDNSTSAILQYEFQQRCIFVLLAPWLYCHSAHAPISHKNQSTTEICM